MTLTENFKGSETNENNDSTKFDLSNLKSEIEKQAKLEELLKIGKIKYQKDNVILGETGFVFLDYSKNPDKPIFRIFDSEAYGLGDAKEVFPDGRVIFEKGFGYVDQDTFEKRIADFESLGIDEFVGLHKNGLLLGKNTALKLDFKEWTMYDLELGGNIETKKGSFYTSIRGSEGLGFYFNGSESIKTLKYKQLKIGEVSHVSELQKYDHLSDAFGDDIPTMNEGYFIKGSNGIAIVGEGLGLQYRVVDNELYGKIITVTNLKGDEDNFINIGTKGIGMVSKEGETIYQVNLEDLGMTEIISFGSGKIIGKNLNGESISAKINYSTGEVIYRSDELDEGLKNDLKDLGIKDLDRFGSERFVEHIIKNRENIEDLGDREIILIVHPESDYNSAFSLDNQEMFMDKQDVLYYEVGSENELSQVFEELEQRLPKGVNITHFILGGHGSQKLIRLGKKFGQGEKNFLDVNDGMQFDKYADLFKGTKSITLKSCSTGKGGLEDENMINMISNSFGKYVKDIAAPKEPTNNIYEFKMDTTGRHVFSYEGAKFFSENINRRSGSEYVEEDEK